VLVFLIAAVTAFATGTSWGTMAILFPVVIPLGVAMGAGVGFDGGEHYTILLGAISSIMAGAVFGDHASPISDTTVISSMASACDHIDHVRTQLPYALVVAGVAILVGDIPTALGMHPGISIVAGLVILIRFVGKPVVRWSWGSRMERRNDPQITHFTDFPSCPRYFLGIRMYAAICVAAKSADHQFSWRRVWDDRRAVVGETAERPQIMQGFPFPFGRLFGIRMHVVICANLRNLRSAVRGGWGCAAGWSRRGGLTGAAGDGRPERLSPSPGSTRRGRGAEEVAQQVPALALQHARGELDAVVQARVLDEVLQRAAHPGLRVARAEDQVGDPGEHDRAGAHRARLQRHVERAPEQAPVAGRLRGATDGDHLRVCRRVLQGVREVVPGRDQLAVAHDHRADRNLSDRLRAARLLDREAHPSLETARFASPEEEGPGDVSPGPLPCPIPPPPLRLRSPSSARP
jgi:hypothetical protein